MSTQSDIEPAVWHSELMQAHKRGKGVCPLVVSSYNIHSGRVEDYFSRSHKKLTILQLSIELAINIFGVMTAYWVDYGMSFVDSQAQFRFPLALQCLFALLTILLISFLPESPRWVSACSCTVFIILVA